MNGQKVVFFIFLVPGIVGLAFAQDTEKEPKEGTQVVYPKKSKLDFEGSAIDGELKNPSEFYYQYRGAQAHGSLVKRRPNFHRELLRDVVQSQ